MSDFLQALLAQEEELQFESFTNEDAYELGCIIVKHARDVLGKGIAVHIENDEYPLFTHYMTGTSKDNMYWVNTKKNVVNRYGHSSLYVGEMYKAQGTTFKEGSGLSLDEYQGEGGSFPIIVRGRGKAGTVTVSGLTGEEDHQVAVDGLRTYLTR
ncbi:heme-degrading domain-containing protein [Paenibacillus lycopersici]|uniref:Heme-degrading domain-containing protein n=1 Tax=Paenibacillus lycopersici TaxID=2704462 RepID=A0A6C0G7D7_9BACL|nr:heme-degrading domain-containing protein [Paenibacillus lycopersici]QHT63658.1 heme-degrading domain-containing protein [Paenibacillus lycopersici]